MRSIVFPELPIQDTCWSITTGRDGNIYIGVCCELTGGGSVFIVQYDPVKDSVEYLLDVTEALGEPASSGRAPHSKIHYCMVPHSSGKLYCATHCSGPPAGDDLWRPWHTWDDPDRMHSGFHIFSFDPATEELDDFGSMSPNEGSRAMAMAEKRGLLYGITWPRDHFYVFDIEERSYRDLGRLGDINAQSVWVDADGHGYTVNDLGQIIKYDADEERLITLDARVPKDPDFPSESRSVYDTTPAPDNSGIYGTVWNTEHNRFAERLFKYDFADSRVHDLGVAFGESKQDHAGGLVFGDDGYLYYAASKEDTNRRNPFRMYLFRMDTGSLEKEEIGPFDDGEYHSAYIAKATRDFAGNLYFADCSSRPARIYVFTPEGAGSVFEPGRPLIRSWG